MKLDFRKAMPDDTSAIWKILSDAIQRRKEDGSDQWQDGYPNLEVVQLDIKREIGYVLIHEETIIGYAAILINDEPAYDDLAGSWQCENGFAVVHRVAIASGFLGKGLAQKMLGLIELWAQEQKIPSIRIDTNFDNIGMLRILEKSSYIFRGEIFMRNKPRKAFEKIL